MWRMRRFTYKSCRGGAPVPARSVTDCTYKKHRSGFAAVFLFFICFYLRPSLFSQGHACVICGFLRLSFFQIFEGD